MPYPYADKDAKAGGHADGAKIAHDLHDLLTIT
jgi:hypothetical protein